MIFGFGGSAIGTRTDTDSVSQNVSTDIRQLQPSPDVFFYCTGNNNFDKAINLDISLMYRRVSI